ncbi:MAG: hypothetical protein ACE5HJ_03130 [Thermoplasmata archaeon]
MPVRSLELTSIDAKRFTKSGERVRNVRVDHNSTVTQIHSMDEGLAGIEFRFTANYTGIGVIKIEGGLRYEGDAKALSEMWSQTGKMPDNVASEIHTAIMNSCIQEAVIIARDLRLPPPIPLPVVNVKSGGRKSSGVEVA